MARVEIYNNSKESYYEIVFRENESDENIRNKLADKFHKCNPRNYRFIFLVRSWDDINEYNRGLKALNLDKENIKDGKIYVENINPYIISLNTGNVYGGHGIGVYFGEDFPQIKIKKKPKRCNKTFMHWCGYQDELHDYAYIKVKEPDKLFYSHLSCYHMTNNDDILYTDENATIFRFDYTEDVIAKYEEEFTKESIRLIKEEEERRRKYEEELEIKRNTPGNCEICGNSGADWVIDPYDYELNNIKHHRWLCNHCYEDLCLEI